MGPWAPSGAVLNPRVLSVYLPTAPELRGKGAYSVQRGVKHLRGAQ